ncbi:epithelial-stromal interaction protein 1 isoform X2 [Eleutherodactylus coqui]|uniref:epithelial-stromal interaction protein 1 isoform X2 n=1 Tax=Eleutherodactylus coqui TaxID=57060 RepID=UPI0034623801
MSRQSRYGNGGNGYGIQGNYQSQRNYHHGENSGTSMGQQQSTNSQQVVRNENPGPQASQGSDSSPCQVIQPDPTKREKLLRLARKEEEDYECFKESRRPGPIYLTPTQLGGRISESEARQQQQRMQAQSKYQKTMQREEYKRKQKEEEDAKVQKMKDIQRKKAEKLEEKRQQQDLEKREKWNEDRCIRNNEFLDQLKPITHMYDRRFGQPSEWAVNQEQDEDWMLQQALKDSLLTHKIEEKTRLQEMNKPHHKQPKQQTYREQQKEEEERRLKAMKDEQCRKAEVLKQREEEKTLSQEEERRRVNSAFLDRLQRHNTSQHEYSGASNTWA